jgi:hypothetical protein
MGLVIWKYHLRVDYEQEVELKRGAIILSVGVQNEVICLWVLTSNDPTVPIEPHTIYIVGTGHDADPMFHYKFLGTVQLFLGRLIFHVFDGGTSR